VVNWHTIIFKDFEDDDFIRDKLYIHHVSFEEAIQCFYNPFQVRQNKKYKDRFQLIGRTDGGRQLKIIFQLKTDSVIRLITAWNL